jgi:hypothetical protein
MKVRPIIQQKDRTILNCDIFRKLSQKTNFALSIEKRLKGKAGEKLCKIGMSAM